MFAPQTFTVALAMMVASAVCWGSWANTYKGVKNYRFEFSTGTMRSEFFCIALRSGVDDG